MARSSYTCPTCRMTSYNPNDVKNRYCGNCHAFERAELLGGLTCQWHATAEFNGDEIELTVFQTTSPGPLKEWVPFKTILLDDMHALELMGTLAIAMEHKRKAKEG